MQAGAATLENSMEVPQKTKNRITLWPSNCTTGHLSTGYRCAVSKGHMQPHVYSSTINNSQVWKEPKCPLMDEWIKMYIYIQWSIKKNRQKEWNLAICNYMLGTIMLSEISQKKTKIVWLHSYEDFKRQNRWT